MVFTPFTFRAVTLGCKVNQYETRLICEVLQEAGCTPVTAAQCAQVCLVNTCTVTNESDLKSRKIIRQLIRQNPNSRVLVFGCYAQRAPMEISSIPGVSDVISAEDTGGNRILAVLRTLHVEESLSQNILHRGLQRFTSRHRAFLKIQDGCRQFCTYCAVPHVRQHLRSVPEDEVLTEACSLLMTGYREFILTGIHLGYYGEGICSRASADVTGKYTLTRQDSLTFSDESQLPIIRSSYRCTLPSLLDKLAEIDGEIMMKYLPGIFPDHRILPEYRIRISSIEAHEASDELLKVMRTHEERICPHLHLSMQSGSDHILKLMNRPSSADEYYSRCVAVKEALNMPAITTDIIVGFPGESEVDFLKTCDLAEKVGFAKIHIFRFSPRKGTPAALMPQQIPALEKQRRAEHLAQIEKALRECYATKLANAGLTHNVLAEELAEEPGFLVGTSERYLTRRVPGTPDLIGSFIKIKDSTKKTPHPDVST